MKRLTTVATVAGLVFSAASFIAWALLPKDGSPGTKVFALYLMKEAFPDVIVLTALYGLVRLGRRSIALRTMLRNPLTTLRAQSGGLELRQVASALLLVGVALTIVFHGFYLFKARSYYWRALVGYGYVERAAYRVDELAGSGRVVDAFRLASETNHVVGQAAGSGRLRRRLLFLQGRIERSDELYSSYTNLDVQQWNPVTQDAAYFAYAEALRLNPQNYAAAEALTAMAKRLDRDLQSDASSLCRGHGPFRTLSVLASEDFSVDTSRGRCQEDATSQLSGLWKQYDVDGLLKASLRTRP
jgi:hypothetical protein